MKRNIIVRTSSFLLAAAMTLALASCGSTDSSSKAESKAADTASAAATSAAATSAAEESVPAVTEAPTESASALPSDASFEEKTKFAYNNTLISVGDKFEDHKDKLGQEAKPSRSAKPCVPGAQEITTYFYPGISFQVNYEGTIINMSISEEEVKGTDASTAGGLKLGDTRETAKKLLGNPDAEDEYGIEYDKGEMYLKIYDREKTGIYIIMIEDRSLPY